VRARASLFRGQGTVEVGADFLKLQFENVTYPDHIPVLEECATLAWRAVQDALPDVEASSFGITARYFAELIGAEVDARSFLASVVPPSWVSVSQRAGMSATIVPEPRIAIVNDNEDWRFVAQIEHAIAEKGDVFITANALYGAKGTIATLKEQIAHVEELLTAVLTDLKMENIGAVSE
jgi:hypothetical protein